MMKNVQVTGDGSVCHAHKTSAVNVAQHIPCRWSMRTDAHFLCFLQQHTNRVIKLMHIPRHFLSVNLQSKDL